MLPTPTFLMVLRMMVSFGDEYGRRCADRAVTEPSPS